MYTPFTQVSACSDIVTSWRRIWNCLVNVSACGLGLQWRRRPMYTFLLCPLNTQEALFRLFPCRTSQCSEGSFSVCDSRLSTTVLASIGSGLLHPPSPFAMQTTASTILASSIDTAIEVTQPVHWAPVIFPLPSIIGLVMTPNRLSSAIESSPLELLSIPLVRP